MDRPTTFSSGRVREQLWNYSTVHGGNVVNAPEHAVGSLDDIMTGNALLLY